MWAKAKAFRGALCTKQEGTTRVSRPALVILQSGRQLDASLAKVVTIMQAHLYKSDIVDEHLIDAQVAEPPWIPTSASYWL